MKTPIKDFVDKYAASDAVRFHMPGHKGKGFLGCESRDITEISGADVLYSPEGIILESENFASALFGTAHSYYSAEGSSLAIKAMLAIIAASRTPCGEKPLIFASRNVHKSYIYAAALLDIETEWIVPTESSHICSASISKSDVIAMLSSAKRLPDAIYVTSPDYLGRILDIEGIAAVAKSFGVPLLVDNAHGAYLAYLSPSRHPIALGAAMCADSAHKTLPALTGAAYLHISRDADERYLRAARGKLSLFASTSPSYLILSSLDGLNAYLENGYRERLASFVRKVDGVKERLSELGFPPEDSEPLKIVLFAPRFGYSGEELAAAMRDLGIECEFADFEYLVLMLTPENTDAELFRLISFFEGVAPREALYFEPRFVLPKIGERRVSIRRAVLSASETVKVEDSVGRISASPAVSCPPAIAVTVSGELITREAAELMIKLGISEIEVLV